MIIQHPRHRGLWLFACLVWLATLDPADAQARRDPATIAQATELRQSPDAGAPVLATLASGQQVGVLEMRGEQAKVDAGGRVGWVDVAALRLGDGGAAQSGGGAPRRGERQATVSMGVRGLQPQDVANAQPDGAAVDRLDNYRASPQQAMAYAQGATLASRSVDYPGAAAPPATLERSSGSSIRARL